MPLNFTTCHWLFAATLLTGCSAFSEPPCQGFDDERSADSVTLRVKNDSDVTLYLPAGRKVEPFVLRQADESLPWIPAGCDSCEVESRGSACGQAAFSQGIVQIPPAAYHDFVWPGIFREDRRIPLGCAEHSDDGGRCAQMIRARAGVYELVVEASTQTTCPSPVGQCTCASRLAGDSCVFDGAVSNTHATKRVSIQFPEVSRVEAIFD